jgi:hypothetical protein
MEREGAITVRVHVPVGVVVLEKLKNEDDRREDDRDGAEMKQYASTRR